MATDVNGRESAEQTPERPGAPTDPQTGSDGLPETHHDAHTPHASLPPRPNTPDRINEDGSTTITSKRACNGCGEYVGDITDDEFNAVLFGRPLPDVRRECPTCAPTAPEAACIPMQVVGGDVYCLLRDCNHDIADDADYCGEVHEETICATHSEFTPSPEEDYEAATHAEPWPCKHSKAVAS